MRTVKITFNALIEDGMNEPDIMVALIKALKPKKITSLEVKDNNPVALDVDRQQFDTMCVNIYKILTILQVGRPSELPKPTVSISGQDIARLSQLIDKAREEPVEESIAEPDKHLINLDYETKR